MAYQYTFVGSYQVDPISGIGSFDPSTTAPINETIQLRDKSEMTVELNVDTPVAVALGTMTGINALSLKTVNGKARVRITSADGSQQAVPVDRYLSWMSLDNPITAVDLTRVPGTPTTVLVFLGQKA